jgi:hypothetical protein
MRHLNTSNRWLDEKPTLGPHAGQVPPPSPQPSTPQGGTEMSPARGEGVLNRKPVWQFRPSFADSIVVGEPSSPAENGVVCAVEFAPSPPAGHLYPEW